MSVVGATLRLELQLATGCPPLISSLCHVLLKPICLKVRGRERERGGGENERHRGTKSWMLGVDEEERKRENGTGKKKVGKINISREEEV